MFMFTLQLPATGPSNYRSRSGSNLLGPRYFAKTTVWYGHGGRSAKNQELLQSTVLCTSIDVGAENMFTYCTYGE